MQGDWVRMEGNWQLLEGDWQRSEGGQWRLTEGSKKSCRDPRPICSADLYRPAGPVPCATQHYRARHAQNSVGTACILCLTPLEPAIFDDIGCGGRWWQFWTTRAVLLQHTSQRMITL